MKLTAYITESVCGSIRLNKRVSVCAASSRDIIFEIPFENKGKAALIVQAVNEHDALKSVAEAAALVIRHCNCPHPDSSREKRLTFAIAADEYNKVLAELDAIRKAGGRP